MYYTIGSVKDGPSGTGGSKSLPPAVPLMRNCVSMENLGSSGIQMLSAADANCMAIATDELHRRNALMMQQHPHSPNYNPAAASQATTNNNNEMQQRQLTHHQQQNLSDQMRPANNARMRPNYMTQQFQPHPQRQQYVPFNVYEQSKLWSQPSVFAGNGANGAFPPQNHNWLNWPTRYSQAPAAFAAWGPNDARRFMHPYLQLQQPYQQLQRQPQLHYSRSTMNSKQSLGSDDFRKYRDVAL